MSWLRLIDVHEASGALRRSYDAALKRAGRVYQIVRAMSLAPATLDASMALYLPIMREPGALPRWQRELLAVVTSGVNRCHY